MGEHSSKPPIAVPAKAAMESTTMSIPPDFGFPNRSVLACSLDKGSIPEKPIETSSEPVFPTDAMVSVMITAAFLPVSSSIS